MFQKIVSKTCATAKCETAKRGEVLDASLNLCEECGAELVPRKITDIRKLALTAIVGALILAGASYATVATIQARLARQATDTVIQQLATSYDPATLEKLRSRVTDLVRSRGHDPQAVTDIVDTLKAETTRIGSAPEFVDATKAAAKLATDSVDLEKRLRFVVDEWAQRSGVNRELLQAKALAIVAAQQAQARNLSHGIELAANRDGNQGIEELERAFQRDRDNPWIQANLCAAYLRADRRTDAAASCRNSIRLQPTNWLAHYNLGCIYALGGDTNSALQELRQAVSNVGGDTVSHVTRADLIARMKDDAMLKSVRHSPKFRELAQ